MLTDDDSTWVQVHAALALGRLGPGASSAGPAMLRASRTGETGVREQAMRALALVQPPEAGEAFVIGLKDPSAEVRLIASAGWMKTETIPEFAVQPLVEALRDPETQVRANVALAVSRLDRLPPDAIPLLSDCTADPSDSLRLNATLALRKAPPTATAEIMDHLLEDPNPRVRLAAAGALLAEAPAHAAARAVLEAVRSDPSPRVRESAEELLQSLATPAEQVVLAAGEAEGPAEVVPVSV